MGRNIESPMASFLPQKNRAGFWIVFREEMLNNFGGQTASRPWPPQWSLLGAFCLLGMGKPQT